MTQEPKVDFKSRGYEIEVRHLDTGSVVEIHLELKTYTRWIVKAHQFHGSYSSLETAVTEALKLMKQKLRS